MEQFKKKVIIHLINSNMYSGLEKVAIEIINSLNNEFDFYYACEDGPIEEILKEKNIKRIKIDKLCKKEILKLEKEYKPDIIHCHDYRATYLCGLYVKTTKIIAHLHNNSPWIKNPFHPFCYAFLLACKNKNVKKVLTVSDSIEKEYVFSKCIKDKIEMIGNPIDLNSILNKVDINVQKEYDVCFCGRLTKQKNPIRFIETINKVKNDFSNIKCVMIGDGELKNQCLDTIKKCSLEKNIKLTGFIKNPYQEMAKSRIFCLTSDWEGYGLVAIEALTLGLPCVVSNVGGLPSIVDENCGRLCDKDEEFIDEIEKLLKDEKRLEEFSKNAKNKAKELENFEEYIEKIKENYE